MFPTLFTPSSSGPSPHSALYRIQRALSRALRRARVLRLSSLKKIAWVLLILSQDRALCSSNEVAREQIESAVDHRVHLNRRHSSLAHAASSQQMFIHIATE